MEMAEYSHSALASPDQSRRVGGLVAEIAEEMALSPDQAEAIRYDQSGELTRLATFIDESLFGSSMDPPSYSTLLASLRDTAALGGFSAPAVDALCRVSQRYRSIAAIAPRQLGTCPAVLYKALAMMRRDNVAFGEIEKVAECDPILATSLLSFANSALFSHSTRIHSVGAAIAYIGLDAARHVILAASARPLFTSLTLPRLWEHSVDVAAIAEQLAGIAGMADPSEAFAAGLIHDIGRIVIELSDYPDLIAAHSRLTQASGCAIMADVTFTGREHSDIGADILLTWRLPSEMVDAVRHHHRPEQHGSAMSCILYLAEVVSNSTEDVTSAARVEYALERTGVKHLDWVNSDVCRLGTALAMCG
jgi:putative nucleotidyltransferase with HDIG domain